jgi:hypothetical protein
MCLRSFEQTAIEEIIREGMRCSVLVDVIGVSCWCDVIDVLSWW